MTPDRVSNPGPLAYKSGALPIALRGLAYLSSCTYKVLVHSLKLREFKVQLHACKYETHRTLWLFRWSNVQYIFSVR